MTADKDRLFKKLEHVGEHVVRGNLENGVYGPNDILGHRVRRCRVQDDKSGIGSRLVATADRDRQV